MNRLIEFLKANAHLILFVWLEVIALLLLFNGSVYRNSVLLSSTSVVTGYITEVANKSNEYIGLKDANIELMRRNALLEQEVQILRYQLNKLEVDSLSWNRLTNDSILRPFPYQYRVAQVAGNTLFGGNNYLTIDMGMKQGIYNDMGVVSNEGVVGVVETAGSSYAKVIPLINKSFNLNGKIANERTSVGTLSWDGKDRTHTLLTNLPKHAPYEVGDSVVTSGYSSIFPEGLFIGTVVGEGESPNDNFKAVRVRLGVSFDTIKYVYVLLNYERNERVAVEEN